MSRATLTIAGVVGLTLAFVALLMPGGPEREPARAAPDAAIPPGASGTSAVRALRVPASPPTRQPATQDPDVLTSVPDAGPDAHLDLDQMADEIARFDAELDLEIVELEYEVYRLRGEEDLHELQRDSSVPSQLED